MSEEPLGHFRCYLPKKFSEDALRRLGQAGKIVAEYEQRGYVLTLRALHYKLVAAGLQENTVPAYNRLGALISDGRLAGLVSWTGIEDVTRSLRGIRTLTGPGAAVKQARAEYARDLWVDQEWRPEVWVEKQALESVVGRICNELRVNFFACRGYTSQSAHWEASQRLSTYVQKGQRPIIFHLGDHDPSGIDMTRDIRDRLEMFVGIPVIVHRLGLNMNQIEQYDPPPNPAKVTDSRFEGYQQLYGDESWELDALDPDVIAGLIREAVFRVRDEPRWDAALAQEADEKDTLDTVIEELG